MAANIYIKKVLNKRINIIMKNNKKLNGILMAYDKFMNVILADVEEHSEINNKKIAFQEHNLVKKMIGLMILRGNQITYLYT
mmetsp:Transcript_9858/g.13727  ORF Transcript_9858/g.13727 Transcript_9858/m.13727 type:complete len:82 (+) Transcript_9858:17-262(+)